MAGTSDRNASVMSRSARLDESVPGSGLRLAIVSDFPDYSHSIVAGGLLLTS